MDRLPVYLEGEFKSIGAYRQQKRRELRELQRAMKKLHTGIALTPAYPNPFKDLEIAVNAVAEAFKANEGWGFSDKRSKRKQ